MMSLMYTIQRVKASQPGPDGQAPPPASHWATKVGPQGNVVGWTPNPAQAEPFPADLCRKVRSFYAPFADDPKCGVITFHGDAPLSAAPDENALLPGLCPEEEKLAEWLDLPEDVTRAELATTALKGLKELAEFEQKVKVAEKKAKPEVKATPPKAEEKKAAPEVKVPASAPAA